jgi:FkbM family methyltransferase
MLFKIIKKIVRKTFLVFGYNCVKSTFPIGERMGINPFVDMAYFLKDTNRPIIFDVGANEGQTVHKMKKYFPIAYIHSFEPSNEIFKTLLHEIQKYNSVEAWNFGLGAEAGNFNFHENTLSSMSSFLESTQETWGSIKKVKPVEVKKLDHFVDEIKVSQIDILKIDTQGFEYEVLKGGENLLKNGRIKLIYLEVTMHSMYSELPPFSVILSLLEKNDYSVVAFYDQHYDHSKKTLHWCDILFVHKQVIQK